MKKYLLFITCLAVSMVILQLLTGWLLTVAYEPKLYGKGETSIVGSIYITYINVLIASTIAFLISNRAVVQKQ